MKKHVLQMIVLIAIILPVLSCFDGPWTDIRGPVPYREQIQNNYCAVACIQMWAMYDGADESEIPQDFIADNMDINYYSSGVEPEKIEDAVDMFTNAYGYMKIASSTNYGQDQCIAGCIASIKDFTLSIVPFNRGTHAVLAFGYKWHYDAGVRVADKMYYHDPDGDAGADLVVYAHTLKFQKFLPDSRRGYYWTIIARRKNSTDGDNGLNIFINEGGTFYGGPSTYDPFTFDPRDPIN